MARVSKGIGATSASECDASMAEVLDRYRTPGGAKEEIIKESKNNYYNAIDDTNSLANNTLSVEASYFISKYGKDIYKKLLEIRKEYLTPPANTTYYDTTDYNKALESIHVLNQVTTIDTPLYNVLDKYLPEYDSNTIYREIEYRDNEYAKLSMFNYYINVLYYILFVFLILLLFSSNKLFLGERFMIYIFLAILPILYPWIFMLFRKIFLYIYPSLQYNGPVNAFVDTNTSIITKFSDNVPDYKKNGKM